MLHSAQGGFQVRIRHPYGLRVLAFRVTQGKILGRVLTEHDDPLAGVFPQLPELT